MRQAAAALAALQVPTVLISQDRRKLSRARQDGDGAWVRTEHGSVLSEFVVEELDLAGIASFVAATDSDGTNTTAAREFAHDLGRAHTYQLRRSDAAEETAENRRSPTDRTSSARRLSARTPFDPPLSYQELEERTAQGMVVRSTSQPPPDSGVTLIALTQPRAPGPRITGPRATQEAQRAD